jgi:NAD(P)-dependent dehydrogenase (short-subunit alcohol dehydrogenase family)
MTVYLRKALPGINEYNKLAGKHVLVIGGTSRIGDAAAEASIKSGVRVTASSSREVSIKTTLERLSTSYPKA